jgi:hypothetical protein
MNGGFGFTGHSPRAAWMSVWHRPDVSILTRTCPASGSGIGASSIARGSPKSWTTAAFIALNAASFRDRPHARVNRAPVHR